MCVCVSVTASSREISGVVKLRVKSIWILIHVRFTIIHVTVSMSVLRSTALMAKGHEALPYVTGGTLLHHGMYMLGPRSH